jgi:hypothetical protein
VSFLVDVTEEKADGEVAELYRRRQRPARLRLEHDQALGS